MVVISPLFFDGSVVMELPSIFEANSYYWRPGANASTRRRNEERRNQEGEKFLLSIGFIPDVEYPHWYEREFKGRVIRVFWQYEETCKNVYKSLSVLTKDPKTGEMKKSNITLLRRIMASLPVDKEMGECEVWEDDVVVD